MNIRVAIVDDDESVCRSLSRLLNVVGMEALSFPSGEAFLVARGRMAFDCIVLDIQLGGMSGLELQALLASEGDPAPIIFITAHDSAASRREAIANGCVGFFRKTDPGAEVIAAIRKAARCSLDRRQTAAPVIAAAHFIKE